MSNARRIVNIGFAVAAAPWLTILVCRLLWKYSAEKALLEQSTSAMIANNATNATRIVHALHGGCPDGWRIFRKAFQEKNGETRAGCYKAGHDLAIELDYLLPGETVVAIFAPSGDTVESRRGRI